MVLVLHVPPPIVLPREGLASLSGIEAARLGAVELARLVVPVVHVPLKVRDRAEAAVTSRMIAGEGPLVIPLVMTIDPLLAMRPAARQKAMHLLELIERTLDGTAVWASKPPGRPAGRSAWRWPRRQARGWP